MCGDYIATVNAHIKNDKYFLTRNEEILAKLSASNFFTIFDLKAFEQTVDNNSKILTRFITNIYRELFSVFRLTFGVNLP